MTETITYNSLGEAYRQLATLPQDMLEAALQGLNEAADFMVIIAKGHVLVDTGTLQNSIHKELVAHGVRVTAGGLDFINPKTGKPCDYAVYVEHKNPFMQPAWESIRDSVEKQIRMAVASKIE